MGTRTLSRHMQEHLSTARLRLMLELSIVEQYLLWLVTVRLLPCVSQSSLKLRNSAWHPLVHVKGAEVVEIVAFGMRLYIKREGDGGPRAGR